MSKLSAKKQAAQARLDAAKSKLSPSDLEEIAERAALSKLEDEAKVEEERARDLDLQRRLEAAEELKPGTRFTTVAIEGLPDTFVVQCDGRAHVKWENELSKMAQSGKGERSAIHRGYAQSIVHDWNGTVRDDSDSEFTVKLVKYLTDNPGVVTPLTDAAIRLAGAVAAERKS
jgi:hypothetical protein